MHGFEVGLYAFGWHLRAPNVDSLANCSLDLFIENFGRVLVFFSVTAEVEGHKWRSQTSKDYYADFNKLYPLFSHGLFLLDLI